MLCKFPKILSDLRREKGISQKKAASELGISPALLSHYENGIRECGLDFLLRLSEYYSVSCDYLLGKSDIMNPGEYNLEPESAAVECVLKAAKEHSAPVYSCLKEIAGVGEYRMMRALCDTASRSTAFSFQLDSADYGNLCSGAEGMLYSRLTALGKERKKLSEHPHETSDKVFSCAEELLKKLL